MKAHYEEIEVSGALNRVRNMSFKLVVEPVPGMRFTAATTALLGDTTGSRT